MEFTIKVKDFMDALDVTGQVVPTKSVVENLKNILVEKSGNYVSITSTNLEQMVRVELNSELLTASDGERFIVEHSILRDAVASLKKNEEVKVVLNGPHITLDQGSTHYELNVIGEENFSDIEGFTQSGEGFTIPSEKLNHLINSTLFAVSKKEESRKEFRGIYFEAKNNKMRAVGTNGTMLAVSDTDINIGDFSFIIPWKATDVIGKFIKEGDVEVKYNGSVVSFKNNNITISTLVINGTFPPYEHIIPGDEIPRVELDNSRLIEALNHLKFIALKGNGKVHLSFNGDLLKVKVQSLVGKGEEVVPCEGGISNDVIFYINNLLDVATHIEDEKIAFYVQGNERPVKMKGGNSNADQFVIMPQRA